MTRSWFDVVYRYADGYAERLPALAEELVRLKPNIILAAATGQAVAAKNATATIPIVTPALADAVHLHLIASEARPGGNVTGITPYVSGLPAKQMELRCTVPTATPNRSAILRTPSVRPGAFKASWIRFSSSGAMDGRPRCVPSSLARFMPARTRS